VFVNFKDQPPAIGVKPGDLVAVTGFSGKGRFAPVVVSPVVRRPWEMAVCRHQNGLASMFLFTGTEDGQWVELEGVVRSLRKVNNTLLVNIATALVDRRHRLRFRRPRLPTAGGRNRADHRGLRAQI
jgi:hypothetical protein